MSAKHTPGPWTADMRGTTSEGDHKVRKFWPGAGAYQVIADASYAATHGSECEANARLIAAAPELLAKLENIVRFLEVRAAKNPSAQHLIKDARAAIAKATGAA